MNEKKYKEELNNWEKYASDLGEFDELTVHLEFDEEPKPYTRPRFVRRGKRVRTYNTRTDKMNEIKCHFQNSLSIEEKNLIYKIISAQDKYDYYVKVSGKFFIKIPKAASIKNHVLMEKGIIRPIVCRGDVDNYIKLELDVLHDVTYDDDKHVIDITSSKYYSDNPRTELTVTIIYNKKAIE